MRVGVCVYVCVVKTTTHEKQNNRDINPIQFFFKTKKQGLTHAATHPEPILERERRARHHEPAHHQILLPPRRVQRPHLLLLAQHLGSLMAVCGVYEGKTK